MKNFVRICFLICVSQISQSVYACQPPPPEAREDTQRRVKSDFKAANFVVLATVISVKDVKYATKAIPDFEIDAEKVTFRIDEVFKGHKKVGETFDTLSYSTCARSVKGRGGVPYGPPHKKIEPRTYMKKWMIYYTTYGDEVNGLTFEITASTMSRPASEATFDIAYLRQQKNKTSTNQK